MVMVITKDRLTTMDGGNADNALVFICRLCPGVRPFLGYSFFAPWSIHFRMVSICSGVSSTPLPTANASS
jgi:hypothetical protein